MASVLHMQQRMTAVRKAGKDRVAYRHYHAHTPRVPCVTSLRAASITKLRSGVFYSKNYDHIFGEMSCSC